jgi:hypothetical protein
MLPAADMAPALKKNPSVRESDMTTLINLYANLFIFISLTGKRFVARIKINIVVIPTSGI